MRKWFSKFKFKSIKLFFLSFFAQLFLVHWPSQKKVWLIFGQLLILFIILGLFFFGVEAVFIQLFRLLKII